MEIDRRSALIAPFAAALAGSAAAAQTTPPTKAGDLPPGLPQPTETIDLWPGGAPGMPASPPVEHVTERSRDHSINDRAVTGISVPRMVVFRPRIPNSAALLIMPGGGYTRVVIDREGYELARYFADRGITCFVLFYRLPGDGWKAGPNTPLQDAQRAMRLIRSRARDYALAPERIAAMGFSAGGHLCADLATRYNAKVYEPVDAADTLTAKPFVAAPIYPVVTMIPPLAHEGSRVLLVGKDASRALEEAHSPQLNVTADTPPCFLCAAEDDPAVPVENTVMLRAALKAHKVTVETHLFANGGHGFGMRGAVGKPVAIWPELFLNWARTQGFA
ncbi:MAG TPA: alpha/beta hydrolase [Sphingomonas sp.]|nr:alpha/beta hydrolase [Sphingomonas sp.]